MTWKIQNAGHSESRLLPLGMQSKRVTKEGAIGQGDRTGGKAEPWVEYELELLRAD